MKKTKAQLWDLPPVTLPHHSFVIRSPQFSKKGIEFEKEFLEQVLRDDPENCDCLRFLAEAHTLTGSHERALELDVRLARLKPRDPIVFYNLACSLTNVGQVDSAFQALGRAVDLGYRDVRHLEQDRDLDRIRSDKRYKALLLKLTK
jgi:tetratricopeptide (TPR) repeat protein